MSKRFTLTEQERKDILGLYEQMVSAVSPTYVGGKKIKPKGNETLDTDDAVDYISAGLDVIPGYGNLASAGIDVLHSASYMYRFFKTNNEQQKIEYGVMALITLIMTFIPLGGNLTNITTRNGLKSFIRRTPEEILHILQKAGLHKQKIWALQKGKWNFSIGLFVYKVTQSEAEEIFPPLYGKLNKMLKMTSNTPWQQPIHEFKNMVDFIYKNKEDYKKIVQYV